MKDLKYYFDRALKENFALGAFNFSNLTTLQGIVTACKKLSSPAIISVSEGALKFLGDDYIMAIANCAKKEYPFLFLHLDHGKNFEICKKAVDLGFDSVMIDGSSLGFEENVALTKKVTTYAHDKGVLVEGELGQIKGIEDETSSDRHIYTDALQAKEFVERTNVDTLAVAIGTSHGAYKYSGAQQLRFDILSEIEEQLKNFPLVLHGASTVDNSLIERVNAYGGGLKNAIGISKSDLQTAVKKHNVVKINTDTDLRLAMTGAIRKSLNESPENFDPRSYLTESRTLTALTVEDKIHKLFFSEGKI